MFEFISGMLFVAAFGCWRAVRSEGWDDSNILNWLRMFSLICIHPVVFVDLYRLTTEERNTLIEAGFDPVEPFSFIRKDEFSENFPNTRS